MLTGCLARKLHSRMAGSTRSLRNIKSIAVCLSWLPCEGGQIAPDLHRDHHSSGSDTSDSSQEITRGISLAPNRRVNIISSPWDCNKGVCTMRSIPAGYHAITPLLTMKDVGKAIGFYQRAFGAEERTRFLGP